MSVSADSIGRRPAGVAGGRTGAAPSPRLAFEDEPCPGASWDDLDGELLETCREALGYRGSNEGFLAEAGYLRNDALTNGAVIMFARSPNLLLPCARVHVGKFSAVSAGEEPICIRDLILDGPLPILISLAEETVAELTGHVTFLDTDGRLRQVRDYPRQTWVDGLIGALMHRSYRSSSYVHITIFNDRMQIVSPGTPTREEDGSSTTTRTSLMESRNPRISHTLAALGISRESVERDSILFDHVTSLEHPVFDELDVLDGQSVRLTIKSNIGAWDQLLKENAVDGRMLLSPIYSI